MLVLFTCSRNQFYHLIKMNFINVIFINHLQVLRRTKVELLQAADDLGMLDGPAVKRLRPYREEYATGDYPNTDDQYPDTALPAVALPAVGPMTREQIEQVLNIDGSQSLCE